LRKSEGRQILSYYENVFIARQDITAEQVEALADGFTKVIEDEGGKVASRENWGLRGLAYKIKKNRKGHYVLMNIDAPAAALHEMERQMGLNEDVLRHMTIRLDELADGPSVIMASKGNREDRPRRDKPYENRDATAEVAAAPAAEAPAVEEPAAEAPEAESTESDVPEVKEEGDA
jgi:small subunit ribosomal protein S6